jgi:hypothetical protein
MRRLDHQLFARLFCIELTFLS